MKKQLLIGAAIVGLMASTVVHADHHEEAATGTEKSDAAGCGGSGCKGNAKAMDKKMKGKKAVKATKKAAKPAEAAPEATETTEEPTK